jgi:hypothetical protein
MWTDYGRIHPTRISRLRVPQDAREPRSRELDLDAAAEDFGRMELGLPLNPKDPLI